MAETLDGNQLESTTVAINRTSTTVKGGRRLSFSALVVVGNRDGKVGIGYGKGRGVPVGIEKAQKVARKEMVGIKRLGATVPHEVIGRSCASTVKLIPAAPGTGVIAGGTVRAVLEMAGVRDCLTKAYGSTNKINLCRAVMDALAQLRTREEIAKLRGVEIEKSTVDEALDANKRYMTDEGDSEPKKKAKGPTNEKDEAAKKTRGRGGRGGPGGGRGGNAGKPAAAEAGDKAAGAEKEEASTSGSNSSDASDGDQGSVVASAAEVVTGAAGTVASAAGAVVSAITGGAGSESEAEPADSPPAAEDASGSDADKS